MRPRSLLWAGGLAVAGTAVGILALAHAPQAPSRSARLTLPAPDAAPVSAVVETSPAPMTVTAAPKATKRSTRRAATPAASTELPTEAMPGAAGLIVGVDPETGALGMPSKEQLLELEQMQDKSNWSMDGLQVVHHPDGSKSIDVQGRFMESTVVRTGPDGKLIYDCVQGPAEAKRIMNTPVEIDPASGWEVK